MSKVKVVMDPRGMEEFMKSDEIAEVCRKYADKIVDVCGEGYEADTYIGEHRVNAGVKTTTPHAHYSNLKHNTMLRAISEVTE